MKGVLNEVDTMRRKVALFTSILHPDVLKVYFDVMSTWKSAGTIGFRAGKSALQAEGTGSIVHDPFLVQVAMFQQLLSYAKDEYMVSVLVS